MALAPEDGDGRRFLVEVEGKLATMLAPSGTTLIEARRIAVSKFGERRVARVEAGA